MNFTLEESLLNAYVDDELALEERRLVEQAMSEDPAVAHRIAKLRNNDLLLRDALRSAAETRAPTLAASVRSLERMEYSPGTEMAGFRAWLAPPSWWPVAAGFGAGVLGALVVSAALTGPNAPPNDLGANRSEGLRAQSLARALESQLSGKSVHWRNPDQSEQGEIVPVRTYKTTAGQYCREFEESFTRGGETFHEHGVACREATGEWRVRIRYYP